MLAGLESDRASAHHVDDLVHHRIPALARPALLYDEVAEAADFIDQMALYGFKHLRGYPENSSLIKME